MLWKEYIKVARSGFHLLVEGDGGRQVMCAGKSCLIVGGDELSNNFRDRSINCV